MLFQNLFIIGSPRSGTSMLRMIIGSHSSIVVPPECGFIHWWYEDYKNWDYENGKSQNSISSYISDLKKSKKIETWGLDYHALSVLLKDKKPESYNELSSLVIHQYAIQQNKSNCFILGDKNNYYVEHLDLLKHIFPKAKYLIITRDCRDVVCSCLNVNALSTNSKYKPTFPETIREISLDWVNKNSTILKFFEAVDSSDFKIIRYEDLLKDPKTEIKKCTNMLNLDYEDKMLDFYKNKMEPISLLDWKKKTNEKLDKTNTQKYLNELSSIQLDEINIIAGNLMNKLGYF